MSILAAVTVAKLSRTLKIPVHRVYYAIRTGKIEVTIVGRGCYLFSDAQAEEARKILCAQRTTKKRK